MARGALGAALLLGTLWPAGILPAGRAAISGPIGVAQSFGAHNASGSATLSSSPSAATTAGDLLVATIRSRNTALAPVSSVTDTNAGDHWVRAASVTQGSHADGEIWYAANAVSLATSQAVTVTVGGTSAPTSAIAFTVLDVTGASTSPLDMTATKSGSAAPVSTGTTAPTTQASEIAVGDIGWNSSVSPSAQTAGYTTTAVEQSTVSGRATGEQAAWRLLTTTGAQSYSATLSSPTVAWTGAIATFKLVASTPPPTIMGFSPTSGSVGMSVVITGSGFSGASAVGFNATPATYSVTDDSHISTSVPPGATTGPIMLTAPGGSVTSTASFAVNPPAQPTITGFNPTSGSVGMSVAITGSGFSGASAVGFNGTPATYSVADDSHISTSVPTGATTGPIMITAPGGSVTSTASFTVNSSASPIQHIVVLYQENHSFDNVLGAWCAQNGRCLGLPSTVTLKGGVVITPTQATDQVPSMGHAVADQVAAIDGGNMDGWAGVSGCGASSPPYACVSYYSPTQVPNITALAGAFTVSDHTFSMGDSPSFGGHLYAVAASMDGFNGNNPRAHIGVTPGPGWGCDSNLDAVWAQSPGAVPQLVPSCVPDPSLNPSTYPYGGAYRATPVAYVPTIMDRLNSAGRSWRLYTSGVKTAGGSGSGGQYSWSICPSFAECLDTADRMNMVPVTNFLNDAKNGTLPNFSIVLPQGSGTLPTSQHNGTSMAAGDNWIGQVASALEQGPEWQSTALFITYDDCGCFYDHLAPGVNPDGTQQGIRAPMVIVSPYARAGYTDSTPATFASILAFAEQTFGLAALGANDAGAYPFSNSFDFSQVPLPGVPMVRQHVATSGVIIQDPNDPT